MTTNQGMKFRLVKDGKIVGYEQARAPNASGNLYWAFIDLDRSIHSPTNTPAHTLKEPFTGFKDSADKDIYRGDILYGGGNFYSTVEWNDESGQWFVCPVLNTPNYPLCNHARHLHVVGNVHENPELAEDHNEPEN